MRIAILDDNADIGTYVQTALSLDGHLVTVHTSAQSLLNALVSEGKRGEPLPYDLVLIDIFLAEGPNGIEVYQLLHEHLGTQMLPVIFVTATDAAVIARLTAHLPTVPVLYKPFRLMNLRQLIASTVI